MSDIVIRVENLSKKYTIGRANNNGRANGEGLRHALQHAATAPFRGLRKFGKQKPESQNNFSSQLSAVSSQNSSLPAPGSPLPATSLSEEFWALKDVTFDVKRGEVLGIIGRNGAGKSTLLKILSRITEPTSGRIGIKGRVASLLEVGTGFHPELTGRENIFLNGAILGMSRAEVKRKFDEIVDFSGVEQFLDTPVKRYSSGMYVRLAFAVAAHLEPEILIVDEVLAVGDAEFQRKCLGKMHDVSEKQGRTVLFVSHNLAAISSLCQTTLVLKAGNNAFQGPVCGGLKVYASTIGRELCCIFPESPDNSAFIISMHFIGSSGEQDTLWDAACGCLFRVKYKITRTIPRLELSLRLENNANGYAGTIFAGRSGNGCISKEQGVHEYDISIGPQNLVPGDYSITIWLHDPMTELFDIQENVLAIEIVNSGADFTRLGSNLVIGAFLLDPAKIAKTTLK